MAGFRPVDLEDPEKDPEYIQWLAKTALGQDAGPPPGGAPPQMAKAVDGAAAMTAGARPDFGITVLGSIPADQAESEAQALRFKSMSPDEKMREINRTTFRQVPPDPMDDLPDRPSPGQAFAPTRTPGETQQAPAALQELWGRITNPQGMTAPLPAGSAPPPEPPPAAPSARALAEVPGSRPAPRPRPQLEKAVEVTTPNAVRVQSAGIGPGAAAVPPPSAAPRPVDGVPPEALAAARQVLGMDPLDSALKASADNRLIAGLTRAGAMAIGRGTGAAYDALDANADRPLEEFGLRKAESAEAQAKQAQAADADPNSPQSQQARATLGAVLPGFAERFPSMSAAQIKSNFPMFKELIERETGLQRIRAEGAETRRTQAEKARGGGAGGGKILPSTETAKVGDLDSAVRMVDQLMTTRSQKADKWHSGVSQYLPATDAAEYQDTARTAAQVVGYILEGGKLSDADVPRYVRMLPTAGDSDSRAQSKVQNIKRLLSLKRQGQLEAFGRAGYRVIDLLEQGKDPSAESAPASGGGAPSGQDAAALQWLRANQNHPSAAKVAERLRAKGAL
jgi:hypothetical protein